MNYPIIDFRKAVEVYINGLDRKPITKESYQKILNSFVSYLEGIALIRPNKEDIMAYKDYLANECHVGAATIQKVVVVLRGFFIDLASNNVYPNIMMGIRGVKITKTFKRESLTLKEVSRLLNKAHKLATDLEGKRNYAIVSLIATTGLRTIEVERANKEDLSIKNNIHILYVQGKGRDEKSDYVKISNEIYNIIEDYLLDRNDNNEALFVTHSTNHSGERLTTRNIRGVIKELLRRIDIDDPHYSAHSLRHSFATNLIKSGMPIESAQLILRHKDLSTTMIYNHSLDRESNNGELIMSDLLFKKGESK